MIRRGRSVPGWSRRKAGRPIWARAWNSGCAPITGSGRPPPGLRAAGRGWRGSVDRTRTADRDPRPQVSRLPLPGTRRRTSGGADDRRWAGPGLHALDPRRIATVRRPCHVFSDLRADSGPRVRDAEAGGGGTRGRQPSHQGPAEHPAESGRFRDGPAEGASGARSLGAGGLGASRVRVVLAGHGPGDAPARLPLCAGIGLSFRRDGAVGLLGDPLHPVERPARGDRSAARRRRPRTANRPRARPHAARIAPARLPGGLVERTRDRRRSK